MTEDELNKIAEKIASDNIGTYNVYWGEIFEALSGEDRETVETKFWEINNHCDGCGWIWDYESLEFGEVDGIEGNYCWQCAGNMDDEECDEEE